MPAHIENICRLEIDASDSQNLVSNHSGQNGTVGWTTATSGTLTSVVTPGKGYLGRSIFAQAPSNDNAQAVSDPFTTSPGEWVSFQMTGFVNDVASSAANSVYIRTFFYNSSDVLVGSSVSVYVSPTEAEAVWSAAPAQAPANTARARVIITHGGTYGQGQGVHGVYFSKVMAVKGATQASVTNVPFTESVVWQNMIGGTYSIQVRRGANVDGVTDKPQVGSLTATLSDPLFDPAKNVRMQPQRLIRLTALHSTAGWVPIFTGRVSTLDTNYSKGKPKISIVAVDAWATLDAYSVPTAKSGSLRQRITAIVAGSGIASYTYDSDADTTQNVLTVQDSASATEQLTWARNSLNGFVYVDKSNVVQGVAQNSVSGLSSVYTFSDSPTVPGIYFTDIDTTFSSQALVNSLLIERRNVDQVEDNGTKVFGPYRATASVLKWGEKSATVTVTDGTERLLAEAYLKNTSDPKVSASSVKFNARQHLDSAISMDLYRKGRVKFAGDGVNLDDTYRILTIDHDITPASWETTVGFRLMESSTAVTVSNPPGGPAAGPSDITPPTPGILGERSRGSNFNLISWVTVPFDQVQTADGIVWDNGNLRFVIPRDGRYTVLSNVLINPLNGGLVGAEILVNGIRRQVSHLKGTDNLTACSLGKTLKLVSGDTVQIRAYASAATTIYGDGNQGTSVSIAYIGQ
jgi:hypothetical protein